MSMDQPRGEDDPGIRRDITFTRYLELVREAVRTYREWRLGQAFFSVLWGIRPDLSEQVARTDLDPFDVDDALPDFLKWVAQHWEPGADA